MKEKGVEGHVGSRGIATNGNIVQITSLETIIVAIIVIPMKIGRDIQDEKEKSPSESTRII